MGVFVYNVLAGVITSDAALATRKAAGRLLLHVVLTALPPLDAYAIAHTEAVLAVARAALQAADRVADPLSVRLTMARAAQTAVLLTQEPGPLVMQCPEYKAALQRWLMGNDATARVIAWNLLATMPSGMLLTARARAPRNAEDGDEDEEELEQEDMALLDNPEDVPPEHAEDTVLRQLLVRDVFLP